MRKFLIKTRAKRSIITTYALFNTVFFFAKLKTFKIETPNQFNDLCLLYKW